MAKQRWVPENATEIKGDNVVVYSYTDRRHRPAAVCYGGKRSAHDWHSAFYTEADRDSRIKGSLEVYAQRAAAREDERKAKVGLPNPFKVGDVLVSSWGYDQTNIDFYLVLSTTKRMVTMSKCGSKPVEGSEGFMTDQCLPETRRLFNKPLRKRVGFSSHNGSTPTPYVTLTSYSTAFKWNGKPERRSWYA